MENHQYTENPTKFKGWEVGNMHFNSITNQCTGCSNNCEVITIVEGEMPDEHPKDIKDIKGNINGREVSITNGGEAVAFELRGKDANGKLLYFSTFIKFEVPLTVSLTYAKLYAVQADGKRILLEE